VGVVIAVARTGGVRTLVPVLVGCISMFDYDYFLSGLIRVISIVPAIATVAGAESHCRYHYHQGGGGSVDVHLLCFQNENLADCYKTTQKAAGISKQHVKRRRSRPTCRS
jgi:hypothetical protein